MGRGRARGSRFAPREGGEGRANGRGGRRAGRWPRAAGTSSCEPSPCSERPTQPRGAPSSPAPRPAAEAPPLPACPPRARRVRGPFPCCWGRGGGRFYLKRFKFKCITYFQSSMKGPFPGVLIDCPRPPPRGFSILGFRILCPQANSASSLTNPAPLWMAFPTRGFHPRGACCAGVFCLL